MEYENLWKGLKLRDHTFWFTWSIIRDHLVDGNTILEVGPGKFPKIPVVGNSFLDYSQSAIKAISARKGIGVVGDAQEPYPFPSQSFDGVCAFEVLEHLPKDHVAFSEVSRVLKPGGWFMFSTPLRMKYWSSWDEWAGHCRRYEPEELRSKLRAAGFVPTEIFVLRSIYIKTLIYARPAVTVVGWLRAGVQHLSPSTFSSLYDTYMSAAGFLSHHLASFRRVKDFESIPENEAHVLVVAKKVGPAEQDA